MSVITRVPEPNLWEVICKEFAQERPPFPRDDDQESVHTNYSDFDPARHNPVFYSEGKKMHSRVSVDALEIDDFDPARCHPSVVGYALVDKPTPSPPPTPQPLPPKDTCPPNEYLEAYIFPVLLPALAETLHQAKENKCFERKRTKFNALDFLTEYLYSRNKSKPDREGMKLEDIPFVQEHWKDHPRPPLPKSLLWTEDEATLRIQAFFRGYKVRKDPEVQELRQWQKDWRLEGEGIRKRVNEFWTGKIENGEDDGSGQNVQVPFTSFNAEKTQPQATTENAQPTSSSENDPPAPPAETLENAPPPANSDNDQPPVIVTEETEDTTS